MKYSELERFATSQKRIVVVVSENRADWNYFDNGCFVKQKTQLFSLAGENLAFDVGSHEINSNASADAGTVFVEIIVNSHLDDIDRVKVKNPDLKRHGRLSNFRLLRHLQSENPQSSVWKLPPHYFPEVASLLHSVFSPTIRLWIKHVQEQGVLISHVLTVPQLLIHSSSQDSQPVLYCLDLDGNTQQHILIDDRSPIYLRCVNCNLDDSAARLEESRAYLSTLVDVDTHPLKTVLVANDTDTSQLSSQSTWLANRLVGRPPNGGPLSVADITISTEELDKVGGHKEKTDLVRKNLGGVRDVLDARQLAGLLAQRIQLMLPLVLSGHSSARHFHLLQYPMRQLAELQPSVNALKLLRRSRNSRILIRLLLLVAILVSLLSVFTIVNSVREHKRLRIEQARIDQKIQAVGEIVAGLHPNPDLALMSLQRRQWHLTNTVVTPEFVMENVAKTIVDYPDLNLDTLLWVVSEEVKQSSERVLNVQGSTVRVIDDVLEPIKQKVTINIKGRIALDFTYLREAQKYLERYVDYLQGESRFSNIVVSRSPVDRMHTKSEQLSEAHGFEISMSLFYP